MLTPEEKNIVASLGALLQELQNTEAGEDAGAVTPESPLPENQPADEYTAGCRPVRKETDKPEQEYDKMETAPEKKEEVMKEEGTEEVANNPAEERIEDEEAEKLSAVVKAILNMSGKIVRKAAPQKSALSEMTTVMKALVNKVNNQERVLEDLLEGIGVSNQIQKSITNTPTDRRPYSQSEPKMDATLEYIAKALAASKENTVGKPEQVDIKKDLSSVLLPLFGK